MNGHNYIDLYTEMEVPVLYYNVVCIP